MRKKNVKINKYAIDRRDVAVYRTLFRLNTETNDDGKPFYSKNDSEPRIYVRCIKCIDKLHL